MLPRVEMLAAGGLDRVLRAAFEHYVRLLRPWLALETREVREVALKGRAPAEVLREEGRRLLAAWPRAATTVVPAADGCACDSTAFADVLVRWQGRGAVAFVVGGSLGLDDDVVVHADERLSRSPLTMSHQLVRAVLAEQLFRALSLRHGHPVPPVSASGGPVRTTTAAVAGRPPRSPTCAPLRRRARLRCSRAHRPRGGRMPLARRRAPRLFRR